MPFPARKKVVFKDISETVLRAAGALIEKKAWFSIIIDKRGNLRYALQMRTNDDPKDLKFLEKHFGGYWWEKEVEGGKMFYQISFQQYRCRKLLETLKDHLDIKLDIYTELEGLFELIRSNKKKKRTEEVIEARKEYVQRMWALNLVSLGLDKDAAGNLKARASNSSAPGGSKQPPRTEDYPMEAR